MAKNPNSSAFGIWQGIYPIRIKYAKKVGVDPNTIDVNEQIAMFRVYIQERYQTAEKALSFHKANGYY